MSSIMICNSTSRAAKSASARSHLRRARSAMSRA
jgi:hypothetical protein